MRVRLSLDVFTFDSVAAIFAESTTPAALPRMLSK